ncbi:MAG: hypothetical protein LYZ66_07265 [Nitrososphaerales archaeon]|nr:hypothetical protein [Nitrososphaerales archaeon]
MTPLEELSELLSGRSRAIAIASRDLDLNAQPVENDIFVLQMPQGSLAAGGRGGGFGERRVVKVLLFRLAQGGCQKLFETEDESKLSEFEIPYYVARVPVRLMDGTETMGYGVVEPELVQRFLTKTGLPSSP